LYYAETINKTDMNIYEIYYINKYKPKYNTRYMNEEKFSLELPELNFKIYKHKNIIRQFNTNKLYMFFEEPKILHKNETSESLRHLYMQINCINNFKENNVYLYDVIKNYHCDFVDLIYDLCAKFEEEGNKIILNRRKTFYFNYPKFDIHTIHLFKDLGIFDVIGDNYVFEKDIISNKYLERLRVNAINMLEIRNIDLLKNSIIIKN